MLEKKKKMKSTNEKFFFPFHLILGTQKCETDPENKTYRFRETKEKLRWRKNYVEFHATTWTN